MHFGVRSFLLTLTMILTMAITPVLSAGDFAFAENGTKTGHTVRVATFDQLEEALANGGVTDIIIDPQVAADFTDNANSNNEKEEVTFTGADVYYIPIEYPLVVSHDVTISSEVPVNFARAGFGGNGQYDSSAFKGQNKVTPAFFNVDKGKTLVLNEDIAMTGEEVSATFDEGQTYIEGEDGEEQEYIAPNFDFSVKSKDGTGKNNEVWAYGSDPGNVSKGGYFIYTKGGNVEMNEGVLLMGLNTDENVTDAAPVYIDGTSNAASLTIDGAVITENNLPGEADRHSTAGAVVVKGAKAQATLTSGEINTNSADVAGVIVDEGAAIEVGKDFAIDESEIYKSETEETAAPVVTQKKSVAKLSAPRKAPAQTSSLPANLQYRNGIPYAEEDGKKVAYVPNTYSLKKALEDSFFDVIDINSDIEGFEGLAITEPLTVDRKVEIRSTKSGGVKIGRGTERDVKLDSKKGYLDGTNGTTATYTKDDKFTASSTKPALFNVTSDGDLTIGSGVTLTGQEVTADYYPADGGYTKATAGAKTWRLSTPTDKKETLSQCNWTTFIIGDGGNPQKYLAATTDVKEHETKTLEFVSADQVLKSDGTIASNAKWTVRSYNDLTGGTIGNWTLVNDDGYMIGSQVSSGTGWKAINTNYVYHVHTKSIFGDKYWENGWGDAPKYKKKESSGRVSFYGWNSIFSNYEDRTIDYLNVFSGDGGKNYITGNGFYNGDNVSSQTALNFYNVNDLQFKADPDPSDDGVERSQQPEHFVYSFTDKTWKKSEIRPAGLEGDFGYFINNLGGKVTLATGSTIRDLVTESDVNNVAPVYVSGNQTSGTSSNTNFKLDGGTIEHNTVGYIPKDEETTKSKLHVVNYYGDDIQDYIKDTEFTNSAGGVIFGNGAKGEISSGHINNNRGDIGAILVKENSVVTISGSEDDTTINNNVGFHHSGAAQIENGGVVEMSGGAMSDNIAWWKGGAVWATEWGTTSYANLDWSTRPWPTLKNAPNGTGGTFIMSGGALRNNTAFARAGAIEVESNNVYLKSGEITGNNCRSLGGAIYVEGDNPTYTYTLVVENGYIGNNSTVRYNTREGEADTLNKRVERALDGNGELTDSSDWSHDYDFSIWGATGNGGGVWLCPRGGTSVFTGNNVTIDNNHKYGGNGTDFFLQSGYGSALLQAMKGSWKNENTNTTIATGGVYNGPLPLINGSDGADFPTTTTGIVMTGNVSRDGGAIAANGTVIFGSPEDVYRYESRINIHKMWDGVDEAEREPVKIEIGYGDPNNEDDFTLLTTSEVNKDSSKTVDEIIGMVLTLSGDSSNSGNSDYSDADLAETTTSQNLANNEWVGYVTLPASINGQALYKFEKITDFSNPKDSNFNASSVFDSTYNSKTELDPSDVEDLKYIFYIAKEYPSRLKVKSGTSKIKIREQGNKYSVVYDMTLTVDPQTSYTYSRRTDTVKEPSSGREVGGINTNFTSVPVALTLTNGPGTPIELTKVGQGDDASGLDGVRFKLFEVEINKSKTGNDHDLIVKSDVEGVELTSQNGGKITLPSGKNAQYFLFEEKAATGYKITSDPWYIVVQNGTATVHTLNQAYGKHWEGNLTDNVIQEHYTTQYFQDPLKKWPNFYFTAQANGSTELSNEKYDQIKLVKVKGNSATDFSSSVTLKGAKFKLYNTEERTELKNGKNEPIGVWDKTTEITAANEYLVSNSDGEIILPDDVVKNPSEEKVFWLEETSAAPGYQQSTSPWLIWIKNYEVIALRYINPVKFAANGSTSVDKPMFITINDKTHIHNEPLQFRKVSSVNTNQGLKDVKFSIYEVLNWDEPDGVTNSNKKCKDWIDIDDWSSWSQKDFKKDNDRVGGQEITNANGEFTFNIRKAGWYLIFEESVASGYKDNTNRPWLLILNEDGTYQIRRHNGNTGTASGNNNGGNWQGYKYYTAKNFVKEGDGTSLNLVNEPNPIEFYKVDETGTDTKEAGTLAGAEFIITKAGMDDDNDWRVLNAQGNVPAHANYMIAYHGLGGISYTIGDNTRTTTASTNAAGDSKNVIGPTLDDGKVAINNLSEGNYFIFEKTAPTGFDLIKSPWLLQVRESNTEYSWNIYALDNQYVNKVIKKVGSTGSETKQSVDITEASISSLTAVERWWNDDWFEKTNINKLVNEPNYLTKVDINTVDSENPTVLEGAEFTLYEAYTQPRYTNNPDGDWYVMNSGTVVADTDTNPLRSDEKGRIYLPSSITRYETVPKDDPKYAETLKARRHGYILVETKAPDGYKLPKIKNPSNSSEEVDKMWWITIDNKGVITAKTTTQWRFNVSGSGKPYWLDTQFTVNNGTKITNEPNDLELVKEDGYTHAKLAGAKFEVYGATQISSGNGTYRYSLNENDKKGETSESAETTGKFTLPNLTGMSGFSSSGTVYFLKEIKAPEDYAISDTPFAILVRKSGSTQSGPYWGNSSGSSTASYEVYAFKTRATSQANVYEFNDRYNSAPDCIDAIPNVPSIKLTKTDYNTVRVRIDGTGDETKQIINTGTHTVYLNGATFQLYRTNASYSEEQSDLTLITTVPESSADGKFTSRTIGQKDGIIELGSLQKGYYLLYERTASSSNYIVPSKPWRIEVNSNGKLSKLQKPTTSTSSGYMESEEENGCKDEHVITNSPAYDLPSAGGIGTYWFSVIGALMMGFVLTNAFINMTVRKKKL